VGVGALQCLPPADYEHAREWVLRWEPLRAAYVGRSFASALLPVPRWELHFWGSSAIFPGVAPGQPLPVGAGLAALALVATAVAVAFAVRRSRGALAAWILGAAGLLGFAYVKFPGATRHWGFIWVLLVAVLWLAVAGGALTRWSGTLLLAPTLAAGLLGTFVAAWWDWRAPFSAAKCAAAELQKKGLEGLPLVGAVDWASSGVAAYLPGSRLYYPASGREGSFIVWNLERSRQDRLGTAEIVRDAETRDRGAGVVLLSNEPIALPAEPGCKSLFQCGPAIVTDESLWGYLCYRAR